MFCLADCERRERQRQMKNDEARSEAQAAREEFFRAVEPEAGRNMLAIRREADFRDSRAVARGADGRGEGVARAVGTRCT